MPSPIRGRRRDLIFVGSFGLKLILDLLSQLSLCLHPGRSVDSSPALLPDAAVPEEEHCDAQNWQDTVPPQLLAELSSRETDRQAVIYGREGCGLTSVCVQPPLTDVCQSWQSSTPPRCPTYAPSGSWTRSSSRR